MLKKLVKSLTSDSIYDFIKYERQKLIYKSKLNNVNDHDFVLDEFESIFGYKINLDKVETMNEKLAIMRLSKSLENKFNLVDKYKVRDFISNTIGREYLIPCICYFTSYEDLDYDALPNTFIIKATHGSSWNHIVYDKSKQSKSHFKYLVNTWLSMNYYVFRREVQYKNITPGIIIEELILDNNIVPKDYKFHCFSNGKILIQVDNDRFGEHTRDFYDSEWHRMPFSWGKQSSSDLIDKPSTLEEMLNIAKKLSTGENYVRVDLYSVVNKVYFGEITFIPEGGTGKFHPKKYDEVLGEYF